MAQQKRHKRAKKAPPPARLAEARIDIVGARGDGVAAVDGARVYAPLTAPGDLVRLSYRGDRGEIDAMLEPSPHRATPVCDYYGQCGGCALQHLTTSFYREWKRKLVLDALAREGFGEDSVAPLVACPSASRRRATFAVRKAAQGAVFGFNERASARIVDISHCPVLAPALDKALPALRSLAAAALARWRSFDMSATLCDNGIDVVFTGGDAADDLSGADILRLTDAARGRGVIRISTDGAPIAMFETPVVRFGGVAVAPPPGGFLQASREGEMALTKFVIGHAKGAKRVADLFCGCGTFSLPLAAGSAVDAFDSDGAAVAALDAAARSGGLRHPVKTERRNLFDRPLSAEELKSYDAVVFDPPRAGARAQAEQLSQSRVPVVIGVSCNPASFARDAAMLRDGGYSLSHVVPVDQFVFSPHVELAGLFTKE